MFLRVPLNTVPTLDIDVSVELGVLPKCVDSALIVCVYGKFVRRHFERTGEGSSLVKYRRSFDS